jgi:hypothetical protein
MRSFRYDSATHCEAICDPNTTKGFWGDYRLSNLRPPYPSATRQGVFIYPDHFGLTSPDRFSRLHFIRGAGFSYGSDAMWQWSL